MRNIHETSVEILKTWYDNSDYRLMPNTENRDEVWFHLSAFIPREITASNMVELRLESSGDLFFCQCSFDQLLQKTEWMDIEEFKSLSFENGRLLVKASDRKETQMTDEPLKYPLPPKLPNTYKASMSERMDEHQ